jgi:hypothetical protein
MLLQKRRRDERLGRRATAPAAPDLSNSGAASDML